MSRNLSYFTGLEVMLLAVLLIQRSQFSGPGTQGLMNTEVFPACAGLNERYPESGHCFEMDLLVSTGFYLAVAATLAYLVSGMAGSPTYKYVHRHLHPDDLSPPPSWG